MINTEKDAPGVYELGDVHGTVLYIGSAMQVKRRLMEHLKEPPGSCLHGKVRQYRVEYTQNFKAREQQLFESHVALCGHSPECQAVSSPQRKPVL